jgi:hypothetical protein
MYTCSLTCFVYFFIARVDVAISNIVDDGIVKHEGVLRHDANSITEAVYVSCDLAKYGGMMRSHLKRSISRMSWPSMRMVPLVTS